MKAVSSQPDNGQVDQETIECIKHLPIRRSASALGVCRPAGVRRRLAGARRLVKPGVANVAGEAPIGVLIPARRCAIFI